MLSGLLKVGRHGFMRDGLKDFLLFYLSRWKMVFCMLAAGLIISYGYTLLLVTPQYEATAIIFVLSRSDSIIDISDFQLGKALTQDYIQAFSMWEVHEQVISKLGLSYDYEEMEDRLKVINPANTRMLKITFRSPFPQEAADVANEYALVGGKYIAEMMQTEEPNMISSALIPANPVSPNKSQNLVMGLVTGWLVSGAVAFISFVQSDCFHSADDIKAHLGLSALAVVPMEPEAKAMQRKDCRRDG